MWLDLLVKIRILYGEVETNPQKAVQMRALTTQLPMESEPLRLAYQAAGKALEARETWLPWEKLACFKESMQLFAQAIAQNPIQIEVRFLRYTIQYNTPSLLGMSTDMAEDKKIILQYIQTDTTDTYMKVSIAKYLLKYGTFNRQELAILNALIIDFS